MEGKQLKRNAQNTGINNQLPTIKHHLESRPSQFKNMFTQHPNHKKSRLHSPSPRHGVWRNPDPRTKIPAPNAGRQGQARDGSRAPRGDVPRRRAGLRAAGSWWGAGPWPGGATPRPPGWAEPIFQGGGACRNPSGWGWGCWGLMGIDVRMKDVLIISWQLTLEGFKKLGFSTLPGPNKAAVSTGT